MSPKTCLTGRRSIHDTAPRSLTIDMNIRLPLFRPQKESVISNFIGNHISVAVSTHMFLVNSHEVHVMVHRDRGVRRDTQKSDEQGGGVLPREVFVTIKESRRQRSPISKEDLVDSLRSE